MNFAAAATPDGSASRRLLRLARRLRRLLPSETRRRAVADLFDANWYRDVYAKDIPPGTALLDDFLDTGWREGRDPSADFSTLDYLADHHDVRASGRNPLVHYVARGRREGRVVRPSRVVLANRGRYPDLLTRLFDDAFYAAHNPDVGAAGVSGVDHYRSHGWREGRSPTPWFDVPFYLASNPDVRALGVDPFAHFLMAGQVAGRLPRDPLLWDRAAFLRTRSRDVEAPAADPETLGSRPPAAAPGVLPGLTEGPLVVSVGNTDYTSVIGGVETCIADEQARLNRHGVHYLYVAPALRQVPLRPRADYDLVVVLDGVVTGTLPAGQLGSALAALASRVDIVRVAIHGLLGHHPMTISTAVSGHPVDYWIHDYYALCANPALTRSGVEFCGAPDPRSGACRLCTFGSTRPGHLRMIEQFFAATKAAPVAPSTHAATTWAALHGRPEDEVAVVPHGHVAFGDNDAPTPPDPSRTPRLAFVGGPLHAKGWTRFLEVTRWAASRHDIEMIHLGHHAPHHPAIRHVPTRRNDGSDLSRKIAETGVDAVLMWPASPETFSLVAHEAMAGGALVVTHPASGNVLAAAAGHGRAVVLDDDHALRRAAVTGRLGQLLRENGRKPRRQGVFVLDGLTPARLALR